MEFLTWSFYLARFLYLKREKDMYILKTKAAFDSAHFLKGYEGKCANIHGHRWTIVVKIKSETVEKEGPFRGMVVDFGKLKADLKEEADRMDHSLIVEKGTLSEKLFEALKEENFKIVEFEGRPTAENFSRYFYYYMKNKGYDVFETEVYETPDNAAIYCE